MKNYNKYKPFNPVPLGNRQWPDRTITKAPMWVSSDLRDGNQALEVPMSLEQKLRFFRQLVEIGFKTIEVSFPAASDTDYNLTRHLIENDLIPDDVAIQVLTQSRDHIIDRTFEALRGAKTAVVHLYNSTSTVQRDVVFNFTKQQCLDLAVYGAKRIKAFVDADTSGTKWILEYSPESFSATEMDFAVEICDAVLDVWQPTEENKAIINLPGTVEMASPNVYADQVEYYCTHTRWRKQTIISLHPHNDRGCAVAATELGLLAGGERVEGTLFGNGERTGNADIVNIAMNLFSHGIDPELDFSNIDHVCRVYEDCTDMQVAPRHPWAGSLVYTSFSGSHQDAIKKGMARRKSADEPWDVPYLPIDPKDVGRSYEPIIRINSQSGKGGVAYILEQNYGLVLPRFVQQEFSRLCTHISDVHKKELLPDEVYQLFDDTYINIVQPVSLISYNEQVAGPNQVRIEAVIAVNGTEQTFEAEGTGLLDAFVQGLEQVIGKSVEITAYNQHAMSTGTGAAAISYVQVQSGDSVAIGAGMSSGVSKSAMRAVVSAVNHILS